MSENTSSNRPAEDEPVPLTKHVPVQPQQPSPPRHQQPPVQYPQQQYGQQQYGQQQPRHQPFGQVQRGQVQRYTPQEQHTPGGQVVHHVHQGPPVAYKDQTVAFLLWLFLGHFGADRFYLNQIGAGVGILLLWLFGIATLWIFFFGALPLLGVLVWWIVNACMIPGQVREINARLAQGRF